MQTHVSLTGAALLCAALAGAQPAGRKEPALYSAPQRAFRAATRPSGLRLNLRRPRELSLGALGPAERAKLAEASTPLRVGVHRALPARAASTGAWETAEDGTRLWRMALRSQGSDGLRLEFRNFDAGAGKVWLYDGESVAGPYTSRGIFDNGRFWSGIVFSETVTLEYEPAADAPAAGAPPFEIAGISHLAWPVPPAGVAPMTGGADPADYCHLDPNCYPDWKGAMNMVASLVYEDSGAGYYCSGSLVGTRDNSFKPYLLTAGHCIHSEAAARSLQAFWKYQTASCGGVPPLSRQANGPATLGSHLLASGSVEEGDYSLVLLKDTPGDVAFSGWDPGEPPAGSSLVGIHHPKGSWKRISFGERGGDANAVVAGFLAPASLYYQVTWDKGRIEPGSSGSPLFSSPGVIVGTLTYGPESPYATACQITPGTAGYGRFSTAYPYLADYLENLPAAEVLPDQESLNFAILNHAAPAARVVQLATQTAGQMTFKLRADAPWIALSAVTGTVTAGQPAQVTISVDPAGIPAPGQYSGTVTILAGAAPPRFIDVTATVTVEQSNVTASASPNPVQPGDGGWSFRLRLAETGGAATRVTGLKINGADYSAYLAQWFGTDRLAANGAIEAPLNASGFAPGDQYFEFRGVDEAGGQEWYRVVAVTLR